MSPVHPRACGELSKPVDFHIVPAGSSPRVRGTPPQRVDDCDALRFIPARAGNSDQRAEVHGTQTVHPRACGELPPAIEDTNESSGSSPRVRGTPPSSGVTFSACRFIPARAGNSSASTVRAAQCTVHPRACGELSAIAGGSTGQVGSSPRVRGTRVPIHKGAGIMRFIPARAGNSATKSRARGATTVHPRACGELSSRRRITDPSTGSSPRVRGTPQA